MICFSVFIAVVRAFMAVSRVIFELADHLDGAVRGLGRWPSTCPASRDARRHLGVDGVGLAGGAAQYGGRPDSLPRHDDPARWTARDRPDAVARRCLRSRTASIRTVCLGPRDQSLDSHSESATERVIAQTDPPAVDCHRDVDMRLCVSTPTITVRALGGVSYAVASRTGLLGLRPRAGPGGRTGL